MFVFIGLLGYKEVTDDTTVSHVIIKNKYYENTDSSAEPYGMYIITSSDYSIYKVRAYPNYENATMNLYDSIPLNTNITIELKKFVYSKGEKSQEVVGFCVEKENVICTSFNVGY